MAVLHGCGTRWGLPTFHTDDTEYAANRSLESRWPGFRVRTLVYCSLYGLVDRRNDTSSRSLRAREDLVLRVLHLGGDSDRV